MRHRFAFPAFLSTLILLLFLTGCWNPFKPDKKDDGNGGNGGGELLVRRTPENVLSNLKIIYGDKDYVVNTPEDAVYWGEQYRELFDPDSFKFHFLPQDVPDPDVYPEGWWGIEEEVGSLEGLFTAVASGEVDNVELEWTVNPSEKDNRVDEQTGELLHPDWKHIHVTSVLLEVVQGANSLRVPYAEADFYFGPDPANSNLWVITEWFDRDAPGG